MAHGAAQRVVAVGVEADAGSGAALRWAAAEARASGATLRIVHAWSLPVANWSDLGASPALEPQVFHDAATAIVTEAGRRAERWLAVDGPPVELVTPEGPAVSALLDAAADADLLVVGSHGRGPIGDLVHLGSVAAACAHRARVPVVVVRPDAAGPAAGGPDAGPVVVGVDGSPGGDRAMAVAARLAAHRAVPLLVVHGWDQLAMPGPDGTMPTASDPGGQAAADHLVADACARARTGAGGSLPVMGRAVPGPAVPVLLDAARSASALVVGSRGRGGFARLVLGSVSTHCLHHAPCPVVVVPEPDGT